MSGGMLKRLLNVVDGVNVAKLRLRAANGNEAIRMGIAKLPTLDPKTMEILARRGPEAVRLELAKHPNLSAGAAKLLRRIGGTAVEATLQARYTDQIQDLQPASVAASAPTQGPAASSLPQGGVDRGTELSGSAPQPQTTAPIESPGHPLLEPSTDREGSLLDPWPGLSTQDVLQGLEDPTPEEVHEVPPVSAEAFEEEQPDPELTSDLGQFIDEIELGLDLLEAESQGTAQSIEDAPTKDRYDESAEIRFMEVFDRFPGGSAGEMLLERLATGRHAPKFRKLVELRNAGLDVEEISITWAVREHWNQSRTVSYREYPLDYDTVGRLVHVYSSIPDVEEVLRVLELLEQRWVSRGRREARTLSEYIRVSVAEYESAVRTGGHAPLDLLLN